MRDGRKPGVTCEGTPGLLLVVAATLACGRPSPAPTPTTSSREAVPVYQEPMHRLVYRNPMVRILDVRIPAGDTTAYHVHAAPMVGIVVQDARLRGQGPRAPPGPARTAAGAVGLHQLDSPPALHTPGRQRRLGAAALRGGGVGGALRRGGADAPRRRRAEAGRGRAARAGPTDPPP